MSEPAVQVRKVWIERSAVSRRCQLKYSGSEVPKECQNTSHWRLMPRDLAVCHTCALYLANNNQAAINAAILAPMLSTGIEPEPSRESNPLVLFCLKCQAFCVLSEDGKRWLCPNGHD